MRFAFMEFNTDKVETTFHKPMTPTGPIEDRRYTLTHSDITAIMFLDIAYVYLYEKIDKQMRDELLGSWKVTKDDSSKLVFHAFVGDTDFFSSFMKYNAFKYHMDIALKAIVYGDRVLFESYPDLLDTPIYVKFNSSFPMFNNIESYGYVKDYVL